MHLMGGCQGCSGIANKNDEVYIMSLGSGAAVPAYAFKQCGGAAGPGAACRLGAACRDGVWPGTPGQCTNGVNLDACVGGTGIRSINCGSGGAVMFAGMRLHAVRNLV